MGQQPLPGLRAQYRFVPAGEAVELRLLVEFGPTEPAGRESVLKACAELCELLAGGDEGKRPPAQAAVVTSVAPKPLESTVDGIPVREAIIRFVGAIPGSLQDGAPVPSPIELVFHLDPGEAAGPPGDLFELSVLLDLGAGTLTASPGAAAKAGADPASALADFAAAFEQAWDGYDGGDGVLKLAADLETVPPVLWCARTGSGNGIGLAIAPTGGTLDHAVPPLSPVLLGGYVEDVDGKGTREPFSAVDLDRLWASFAGELERAAEPDLAKAIRDASEKAADRLALARHSIAGALAARLAPLNAGTPDEEALKAARAVLEEAALARPGCRSPVATVAVAVGGGPAAPGDPVTQLRGRAVTPSGGAGAAHSAPAGLVLRAGQQWLAFVTPAAPDEAAEHRFRARFVGLRLERAGRPLQLLLPDRLSRNGSSPLQLDLGARTAPVPLIAAPPPPILSVIAIADTAEAATIPEALTWALAIEAGPRPAAQDRLELVVTFDPVAGSAGPSPVARSQDLFGALLRAVRAEPLQPGGLEPAKAERFADLACDVAETLARWQSPVPDEPALPQGWRYDLDFADPDSATVTRHGESPDSLPPWPRLTGYVFRPSSGAVARYEPQGEPPGGGGLEILVPGLNLPAVRGAQVHARIRRNGSLGVSVGVNPAFVYVGLPAATEPVSSPPIDWRAPLPEGPAPTLASALDALFASIGLEEASDLAIGVGAELVQRPGPDGPDLRFPLLLLRPLPIGAGEGETPLARYKAMLAEALAAAHAPLQSGRSGAGLGLTIALHGHPDDGEPLARLSVRLLESGPGWWAAGPG